MACSHFAWYLFTLQVSKQKEQSFKKKLVISNTVSSNVKCRSRSFQSYKNLSQSKEALIKIKGEFY